MFSNLMPQRHLTLCYNAKANFTLQENGREELGKHITFTVQLLYEENRKHVYFTGSGE